jgi:hypothetical protein
VLDAARENSYPAPLAAAAEQLYLAGRRAGLGRRDDSAGINVLRGRPTPDRCGPCGCPDLLHRPRLPAHRGSPLASTTQYDGICGWYGECGIAGTRGPSSACVKHEYVIMPHEPLRFTVGDGGTHTLLLEERGPRREPAVADPR